MARSRFFIGSAANTDMLDVDGLRESYPGQYDVYAVSTVTTATITVSNRNGVIVNAVPVPVDPDGTEVAVDRSAEFPAVSFWHDGKDRPTIALGGTTGTWQAYVVAHGAPLWGRAQRTA